VGAAANAATEAVRQGLPPLFAEVVARVLMRIGRLPREPRPSGEVTFITKRKSQLRMTAWLPPSRLLGGFFVVRPIGAGGGGSVFVARRSRECPRTPQRTTGGRSRVSGRVRTRGARVLDTVR
jgi:hypothetical protein